MLEPPDHKHAGSAHTVAIDLQSRPKAAGLETWATLVASAVVVRRIAATCPLALRATFLLAIGVYFMALSTRLLDSQAVHLRGRFLQSVASNAPYDEGGRLGRCVAPLIGPRAGLV